MKSLPQENIGGLFCLMVFAASVTAIAFAIGPQGWFPVDNGAFIVCSITAVVGLLSSGFLYSMLRQKKWPLPSWGSAFFVLAALSFSAFLPLWINGDFDKSPLRHHRSTVLRQIRGPFMFKFINVLSWKKGRQMVTIPVKEKEINSFTFGREVKVTTSSGLLGWEWVRGVKIVR